MSSLRVRLLVTLSLTIFIGWSLWFFVQCMQMTRQQSGYWDRSLRSIGEQILLSLPNDLDATAAQSYLQLPSNTTALEGKFDHLHFQVWILQGRERVVASRQAPSTPMRGDFRDGYLDTQLGGETWRVFAVTDASGRVQVQVGYAASLKRFELMRWMAASLFTALVVLAGLAVATWAVVRKSLKPVVRVQQAMGERQALDLTPLPGSGLPDEVRPLVDSFNVLLSRLDHALQSERQFLSEAAHELRTPLAALLTQAQVAMHAADLDETRQALDSLMRGIERTSRLAQQLLDSARVDSARGSTDRGTVDLAEVVAMVAREFELVASRKRQTIVLEIESCQVEGNLDDLGILVRNLLDNALRYGREGGRVEIACCADAAAGNVALTVRDDGPGVAEEERERIFERFFRGSNGNGERGSGIGLSLVARIARVHGAMLTTGDGIGGRGFGVRLVFLGSGGRV
ncbi:MULTISPECIES: ATP-binding protein [unclassified Pseudoxanthomonas]|uniref:ATP-binding protein n=1 Tax=unclassified Pseudoxanthomonas TaxID=2645906 RepID=UPI0030769D61